MERVREPLSLNRTRLSNSLEARTLAGYGPSVPNQIMTCMPYFCKAMGPTRTRGDQAPWFWFGGKAVTQEFPYSQ